MDPTDKPTLNEDATSSVDEAVPITTTATANVETLSSDSPLTAMPKNGYENTTEYYKYRSSEKFFKFSMVTGAIALLMVVIGLSSSDAGFISMLIYPVLLIGFIMSIGLGLFAARSIMNKIEISERTQNRFDKKVTIGFVLMLLSLFTIGITFIPGMIIFFLGLKEVENINNIPNQIIRPKNPFVKILLMLIGFIGGLVPGLFATVFGAYSLWSHWCDVSGSKCL